MSKFAKEEIIETYDKLCRSLYTENANLVPFHLFKKSINTGLLDYLATGKREIYDYSNKMGSGNWLIGYPQVNRDLLIAFMMTGAFHNDFTEFDQPVFERFEAAANSNPTNITSFSITNRDIDDEKGDKFYITTTATVGYDGTIRNMHIGIKKVEPEEKDFDLEMVHEGFAKDTEMTK